MIDAGSERFVIMAWELFSLKGNDFSKRARKYLEKSALTPAERTKAKIEKVPMPKTGLEIFAVAPPSHDLKREAIMVLAAVIAHPDDTVQFMAFYVNPKGSADIPGVTKLGGSLGIYVGDHPSYQYKQQENRSMGRWKASVTKKKGKVFGSDVEWHRWDKDGWHNAEAILALPGSGRLRLHIFAGGAKVAPVDEMLKIAATLKVSKQQKFRVSASEVPKPKASRTGWVPSRIRR